VQAVETFAGVFMLTLTIDPKIFNDPQAELAYVQKKRCVSKLVAKLRANPRCKLHSERFFCMREFHADGRVHYHVLMDAKYIPFEEVRDAWGDFEPKTYRRPDGDNSPRFGSVHFSKGDFADRRHAARYVTKYLTKSPEHGFPEWVLKRRKRLQRYTVSHHFWESCGVDRGRQEVCAGCTETTTPDEVPSCEPECFCEQCAGAGAPPSPDGPPETPSIEQRVSKCLTSCALLYVEDWMTEGGEHLETRRKFLGQVPKAPRAVADQFSIELPASAKRFTLRPAEVEKLLGLDVPDDALHEDSGPDQYAEWIDDLGKGLRRPLHRQYDNDSRRAWGKRHDGPSYSPGFRSRKTTADDF
jgi:hypothetical protein